MSRFRVFPVFRGGHPGALEMYCLELRQFAVDACAPKAHELVSPGQSEAPPWGTSAPRSRPALNRAKLGAVSGPLLKLRERPAPETKVSLITSLATGLLVLRRSPAGLVAAAVFCQDARRAGNGRGNRLAIGLKL